MMIDMNTIRFDKGSKIELKKPHPCGNKIFTVIRGGTDVRILCDSCNRDMTINREKLEKMIKKVLPCTSTT